MASTQKRTLKMKLERRRGTRAPGKNNLEVSQGLQQRISVRNGGRPASARQPRPQHVQLPCQSPPQPIHGFQSKRQPQLFGGGFEGKSRQHLHQPAPHQRSRQRVARQNLSQNEGKGPPATTTLPTIGTIHPLATDRLPAGLDRIVAQRTAVPVQTASAAAMRTRRLLEGKSWVFSSCASRTK